MHTSQLATCNWSHWLTVQLLSRSHSVQWVINTSTECMLLGRIQVTWKVLYALTLLAEVNKNRFSPEVLVLEIFFFLLQECYTIG